MDLGLSGRHGDRLRRVVRARARERGGACTRGRQRSRDARAPARPAETEAARIGGLALPGDVTSEDDLEHAVAKTVETYGSVDILVWNSGGPTPGPGVGVTPESIRGAFELLMVPAVRLVALCLPHLERSPAGRIIGITSIAAKEPTAHLALSNSIRPGLTGWFKTLSNELGPQGITVNCVAPGRIATARLEELVSDAQQREADLQEMTTSQRVAAAVALRKLGYHVIAKPDGVIIDAVELGTNAAGKLHPTDVIVSVNGAPTLTIAALRTELAKVKPGDTVSLGVRRDGTTKTVDVKTIADPLAPHRALVGFTPDQSADIRLPLKVQIDARGVGGPSAGLAFALQVMEELGKNVSRGYRVAATGQMELNGAVSPIGGVKQKTLGVRKAKADVFLVPAGDNAREALRYAHGLRIIAVNSFAQALHALATLPPKR